MENETKHHTTTAKLAGYSAEPDFAASIKSTCSEEFSNGAACGWMPCTGCYDTEDGHPTAHYRHSRVFGCDVGSGCSECGGLGVVFQYWSPEDLEDMQRDCVSETKTATQDELSYQCDACSVPGYPHNTKCECTSIQQDGSCPVGYPSLLCEVCDGKGIIPTPAPQMTASPAPAPLKRIAEIALGAAEAELEWTDAVDIIASSLNAAQASMTPMLNAAQALRKIVEGIEGTMNHGTWRDDHGRRLKDAPEWVDLYNAVCDAQKVVVRKNQASGKSEALLQSIADKISAHKPSPAATDEYTSGYGDGRYDAWLVVKEAADNSIAPDLRDADGYKHILRASDDIMTVIVDDKEEHPFGDDLEAGDSVESIPLFRDSTKR